MQEKFRGPFNPFHLVYLGFAIILVGTLLIILSSVPNTGKFGTIGGAVVIIGPIPIILGTDSLSSILATLAVILTVLFSFLFLHGRKILV